MQLSIKNVSKTYSNNVEALKDVTLEVGMACLDFLVLTEQESQH